MEYWGVGICLRKRVRREQVLGASDPTVRRAIPFGPRKKAFSGTCRCPHRKVTLAQCRICFQPVSFTPSSDALFPPSFQSGSASTSRISAQTGWKPILL